MGLTINQFIVYRECPKSYYFITWMKIFWFKSNFYIFSNKLVYCRGQTPERWQQNYLYSSQSYLFSLFFDIILMTMNAQNSVEIYFFEKSDVLFF